jgi:PAS domain-containing protein
MDVTGQYQEKTDRENKKYIKALSEVYDKIFEYNLETNMARCLYSNNSPVFKFFEYVPMRSEDATRRWIAETVGESDAQKVQGFFNDFRNGKLVMEDGKPPVISYMAKSSDGQMRMYNGIFIKMDSNVSLYCCRRVTDAAVYKALRQENTNLKENMKRFVGKFTDGAVAFKITPEGNAIPMYYSDNVCEFFGYSRDEWKKIMEKGMSIEQFVEHCDTDYEEFEKLLQEGEGKFFYKDINTGEVRNVRAICSHKGTDGSSSRYVMLYSIDTVSIATENGNTKDNEVMIRTFGYFDVFVGEKPIAFKNKKSKELFALLVDRRGGFVTSDEAIGFLWEDETVNPVTLARYRKVALRLKNTLENYGIADIVESVDGKRRIVSEKVHCDLYDYLTGKEEYANLFKGSYLTNYSWGENTLGELSS